MGSGRPPRHWNFENSAGESFSQIGRTSPQGNNHRPTLLLMRGARRMRNEEPDSATRELTRGPPASRFFFSCAARNYFRRRSRSKVEPTCSPPHKHDKQEARHTSRLDAQPYPPAARIISNNFSPIYIYSLKILLPPRVAYAASKR